MSTYNWGELSHQNDSWDEPGLGRITILRIGRWVKMTPPKMVAVYCTEKNENSVGPIGGTQFGPFFWEPQKDFMGAHGKWSAHPFFGEVHGSWRSILFLHSTNGLIVPIDKSFSDGLNQPRQWSIASMGYQLAAPRIWRSVVQNDSQQR